MSYIENFKGFKNLLKENIDNSSLYEKVYEKVSDVKNIGSDEPLAASDLSNYALSKIPGFKDAFSEALTYIKSKYSTDGEVKELVDNWKRILLKDNNLYPTWLTSGLVDWNSNLGSSYAAMHVTAALCRGQKQNSAKNELKNFPAVSISGVRDQATRDAELDIVATPAPKNGVSAEIYSTGKVSGNAKSVKDSTNQVATNYNDTKHYMNSYNIISACYFGDYYGTKENITENGDLDLNKTSASYCVVFTDTITGKRKVTRDEKTTTTTEIVGYEPALKGKADVAFKNGSFNISDDPKGQTKVDALAKVISEKFKGKAFDKFNLISSASPVWMGKETMANYAGKKTTGTGDPGEGNDFATKNYKLAYNRGKAIMEALNDSLKKLGHAGIPNYTITWQVSDKGGPQNTGRYVDLLISSPENQGKEVTTTTKEIVGNVDQKKSTTTGESTFYAFYLM